jgi:hypothetical protein
MTRLWTLGGRRLSTAGNSNRLRNGMRAGLGEKYVFVV